MPAESTATTGELRSLPIDTLIGAAENNRRIVDGVDELAASIRQLGVLEPLIVTPAGGGYTIVAGHRRHAAAFDAGLLEVPCIVREFDTPLDLALARLHENLQRKDLDPLEEAEAFAQITKLGVRQRDLAERIGCSQSHISKRMALLKLPAAGRSALGSGRVTVAQAEELAKLDAKTVNKVLEGDRPVQDWKINEAVAEQARVERHTKSEKKLADSGLKVLTQAEYYGNAWTKAKRDEAAAGYIVGDGSIVWLKRQPKPKAAKADPAVAAAEKERAAAREARERVWAEMVERHRAHLRGAIVSAKRFDTAAAQQLVDEFTLLDLVDPGHVEWRADPPDVCELFGIEFKNERRSWNEPLAGGPEILGWIDDNAARRTRVTTAHAALSAAAHIGYLQHTSDGEGLPAIVCRLYDYLEATGYSIPADEAAELARIRSGVTKAVEDDEVPAA